MIKVLVVDDHKIILNGIRIMLDESDDIEILSEAQNGVEAYNFIKKSVEKPDLILMDIKMPEMDGIEATQLILESYPQILIIAMTMFDEDSHIRNMLRAGAIGYVLKNADKSELLEAIRTVASGKQYFSPGIPQKELERILSDLNEPENSTESSDTKPLIFTFREI